MCAGCNEEKCNNLKINNVVLIFCHLVQVGSRSCVRGYTIGCALIVPIEFSLVYSWCVELATVLIIFAVLSLTLCLPVL